MKIFYKKKKKTVLLNKMQERIPMWIFPIMEMFKYSILEKIKLFKLFSPTMYNTAVMNPLLLTASIKTINK